MNTMQSSVFIYRYLCYNKEGLSVGTHLNFYYVHDSFFSFLFLFLLTVGGILRRHMSVSMFICAIFLVMTPLEIKTRNSNFANKGDAAAIIYY
jgi:hypothetical protein